MTQAKAPSKPKRPWSTPRIVSTQTAFEHAILACNGTITSPPPPRSAVHANSGGACTSLATANS